MQLSLPFQELYSKATQNKKGLKSYFTFHIHITRSLKCKSFKTSPLISSVHFTYVVNTNIFVSDAKVTLKSSVDEERLVLSSSKTRSHLCDFYGAYFVASKVLIVFLFHRASSASRDCHSSHYYRSLSNLISVERLLLSWGELEIINLHQHEVFAFYGRELTKH